MQGLVLYQKIYDFLLYIYPVINQYPRFEKFALQTQTKNCVLDMLRLTIRANKSTTGKVSKLYEVDALLEELRALFRLANDLSEGQKLPEPMTNKQVTESSKPENKGGKVKRTLYISKRRYEIVSRKLDEIGRLLGGLIKHVQAAQNSRK